MKMLSNDRIGIVLIRVFSDLKNMGYYSVIHNDHCITFLPIIEMRDLRKIPLFLDPRKIIDHCRNTPLISYYRFSKYDVKAIHNDPRIDLGFYTEDNKPSRLPKKKLKKNDIILFMTGLAFYPPEIWFSNKANMNKILYELKKNGKIGIYIVGGLIVNNLIEINGINWDKIIAKYPVLTYSPHYYRLRREKTLAILGRGFYIDPPVKIASRYIYGYRLSRDIISLIGYRNAVKILRQNFRKSSYIVIRREKIEEILAPYMEFH